MTDLDWMAPGGYNGHTLAEIKAQAFYQSDGVNGVDHHGYETIAALVDGIEDRGRTINALAGQAAEQRVRAVRAERERDEAQEEARFWKGREGDQRHLVAEARAEIERLKDEVLRATEIRDSALGERLEKTQAEIERLKARLQLSVCAFCGHEGPRTHEAMAEHIAVCDKHPMNAMLDELLAAKAALTATHQDGMAEVREAWNLRFGFAPALRPEQAEPTQIEPEPSPGIMHIESTGQLGVVHPAPNLDVRHTETEAVKDTSPALERVSGSEVAQATGAVAGEAVHTTPHVLPVLPSPRCLIWPPLGPFNWPKLPSSRWDQSSDAPLPEPGFRLLPKGDRHLCKAGERRWHPRVPRWVETVDGGGANDEAWYAAPEPTDWPKLPPNARRVQFTDTAREGDLIWDSSGNWLPRAADIRPFDPSLIQEGLYARPLPERWTPEDISLMTQPEPLLTAYEGISEELAEDQAMRMDIGGTDLMTRQAVNDHAARLDKLSHALYDTRLEMLDFQNVSELDTKSAKAKLDALVGQVERIICWIEAYHLDWPMEEVGVHMNDDKDGECRCSHVKEPDRG